MVGQLLYSLMPWRISSSSSTFTVFSCFGSTPQAFRIWMARPEKPHMGKLALPFMNNSTSLFFTRSSMRCWASLMGKFSWGQVLPEHCGGLSQFKPAAAGTAGDSRQVGPALAVNQACGRQQAPHGLRLVPAVFQQQPAAGLEVRRGGGNDSADVVQAIGAGH